MMDKYWFEGTLAAIKAAGEIERAGMTGAPAFHAFAELRDRFVKAEFHDEVMEIVDEAVNLCIRVHFDAAVKARRVERKHGIQCGCYHDLEEIAWIMRKAAEELEIRLTKTW